MIYKLVFPWGHQFTCRSPCPHRDRKTRPHTTHNNTDTKHDSIQLWIHKTDSNNILELFSPRTSSKRVVCSGIVLCVCVHPARTTRQNDVLAVILGYIALHWTNCKLTTQVKYVFFSVALEIQKRSAFHCSQRKLHHNSLLFRAFRAWALRF